MLLTFITSLLLAAGYLLAPQLKFEPPQPGSRAGWERRQGLEGEEDFTAPSAAGYQVAQLSEQFQIAAAKEHFDLSISKYFFMSLILTQG